MTSDGGAPVQRWIVQYRPGNGTHTGQVDWTVKVLDDSSANSVVLENLNSGVAYETRVRAANKHGTSPFSDVMVVNATGFGKWSIIGSAEALPILCVRYFR